jgi:hypothetical protein
MNGDPKPVTKAQELYARSLLGGVRIVEGKDQLFEKQKRDIGSLAYNRVVDIYTNIIDQTGLIGVSPDNFANMSLTTRGYAQSFKLVSINIANRLYQKSLFKEITNFHDDLQLEFNQLTDQMSSDNYIERLKRIIAKYQAMI